jgi:hypothetical protein
MNATHNLKRIIGGTLLSGGVAVAGMVLAAGTAQAQPGFIPQYPWCPGQHWQYLTPPPPGFDMTVCHNLMAQSHSDGTFTIVELPPPAPPPPGRQCWALFLPAPCLGQ